MTRLISGKIKKTPSANADPNRYSWLDLQNAEPDLGVPSSNGSLFVSSTTGTRSWSNTITISGTVATINTLAISGNANLGSNSNVKITGGTPGQFLVTDGTDNLFWSSAAISTASGISNDLSSVVMAVPNGNIAMSVAGTSNVIVVSNTGASITGNVGVNGNVTVTTGILTGNGSGLSAIAGANVIGTVPNATAANTAGTVTTNAQPNITSVGALTALTVGNATANTVFGNGTINASGNINAFFVFANVVGNISGNFAVAGSNGEVIFNKEGNAGSSNAFTFNNASNVLTVNGNIGASFFSGNGSALSSIAGSNVTGEVSFAATANAVAGANVSGTVANATFATTAGSTTTAGTVTTNAQPNITSVGTLSNLAVSGNTVISGNLTVDGNIVYVNVETLSVEDPIIQLQTGPNGAPPAANSGKDVGTALNYYDTQARVAFMGWDVSNVEFGLASQASITNEVVTFTSYGNLRVGNIIGNGQALTGLNGANVTGAVPFASTANAVAGANVSGTVANATFALSAGSATTAGTVTTNAQPNITSVGILTGLTVGNATANTVFGNGTINASGNINAAFVFANVVGNISGNFAVAGSNTEVIFNKEGNAGSSNAFTFNNVSNALSVNGTVTAPAFTANTGVFTGNGSGLSAIAGANVTGAVPFATTANAVAGGNVSGTVANATFALSAGTVTTNAQPNITSVGTLTALDVNNTVTAVGFTANTGVFTGNGSALTALNASNISTGTLAQARLANASVTLGSTALTLGSTVTTVAGLSSVTSTTFVGALSGNATTAGTVVTNAQPNITSVGTLTGLTIGNATANAVFGNGTIDTSGNINAAFVFANVVGNISGNFAVAGSNGEVIFNREGNAGSSNAFTFNNVSNALTVNGNVSGGNLSTTGSLSVSGNAVITGNLTVNGNVTYINTETLTVEDPIIQLQTGPNGAAPTSNSGKDVGTALNYFDTAARVAFMGWDVSNNEFGLASVATVTNEVVAFTTYGNLRVANIIGNGQALTGLNGANVTGFVPNATAANTAGAVTTNAQPNITSVGTLTGLTVGNATANTVFGNGTINASGNINAAFVFANVVGNISGNFAVTGSNTEVIFNKEGNAGSSNAFTFNNVSNALSVNGTVTAPAFTANTGVFTGNGSALTALNASNVSTGTLAQARLANASVTLGSTALTLGSTVTTVAGLTSVTSTTFVGALTGAATSATTAGTVTTNAQPNITSVGTLTGLTVGNATANAVFGNGTIDTTGNITAPFVFANVVGNISGNFAVTGSNGEVIFNREGNAGSSNAFSFNNLSNSLSINGTVTAPNFTANTGVFTGNGSALAALNASNISTGTLAQTRLANSNIILGSTTLALGSTTNTIAGLASVTSTTFVGALTGSATSATTAGSVTTNAQPNITSVGVLTGLTVGNATANAIFGNGTIDTTGNITAPFVFANVVGNISGNFAVTGSNTEVIFNKEGNAGSSNGFTFNNTSNALSVNGTVTAPNFTANTGVFTGNGSALTALNASNISTGTLAQTRLANSNVILGSTTLALGSTTTTVAGLTSVTSTTFVGALSGNATTAGTVVTNAQPNITSVGTLTGLTVGNATANIVFGNGTVNAGGNITAPFVFANVVGNISGNFAVTGSNREVIFNKEGNAGSSSAFTFDNASNAMTVTGNITGDNLITGGIVSATGNVVTSANLVTNLIIGRTSGISITATGTNQNITLAPTGTGTVDVSSKRITSLATPSASTDAATKAYVDEVAQGLTVKAACKAATTGTLAVASGGTVTYNNGTAGVGATLTTTGSYTTIDGVTLADNDRILVKNEAAPANNGIYVRTNATVLTRAADFDNSPAGEVSGAFTFISGGDVNGDDGYVCTTDNPVVMGTTAINFTQFSGAGTYTAGTGLTLTGSVFSITDTAVANGSYGSGDIISTFTVNKQGQLTAAANVVSAANAANLTGTTLAAGITTSSLTTVGTLGSLSVTANITSGNANLGNLAKANFFSGDGSALTNIPIGTSLASGSSSVTIPVINSNVVTNVNGATRIVATTDGANVTGTLGVSGNANVLNLGTIRVVATGNISSGNATLGNLAVANFFQGDGSGLTNIPIGTTLSNGSSSVNISVADSNVVTNVNGTTRFVATTAGANITGTLGVTANANVLNLGTARVVATGNISGTQLISTIADGTAPLVVTSTTQVSNLNSQYLNGFTWAIPAGVGTTTPNSGAFTTVTATDTAGTSTSTKIMRAVNGTQDVSFIPRAGSGSYNSLVTADDAAIIFTTAAQGNANLTIAPWALATSGIRIQSVANAATIFLSATNTNVSAALNVVGNVTAGNVSGTSLTGTLATAAQTNITSVGTLTSLGVTGNVTANTFQSTNNGSGTNFKVGDDAWIGDINQADTISIRGNQDAANGYIVFGNADATTKLGRAGSGALTYNGTINPTTLLTTTITTGANTTAGTVTGNWTLTAGSRWQSTYADLAERYVADEAYEPGTVVVLGGEQEVTIEDIADSHKVAGVITTNPAYIMNAELQGDTVVEVALVGRVPCKVVGKVSKGDLLTTSEIAGYAHSNNNALAGRIIGKALENFEGETGLIEILIGRT